MKYLSVVVPCYNSQEYLDRCLEPLLSEEKDIEVILVNDGSTDKTGEIADEYASKYPNMIRVHHKENGGHGSGVNKGLELATGLYFKVIDSDDWVDTAALKKVLEKIKKVTESGEKLDLLICNYVYDHLDTGVTKTVHFKNVFPQNRTFSWEEMGRFRASQYLVMHSLIFNTQVLRTAKVVLPEHTFYVDNLFSYKPLPYVKKIYYMNIDLYHYYLGRSDQSVNEKVLMKNIDQQIKVTKIVRRSVDLKKVAKASPKLAYYMRRNLSIMMAISSIHLLLIGTEEALQKRRDLWEEIRIEDLGLYNKLRYGMTGGLTYLPGKVGNFLTLNGYRIARKVLHFQ